MALIALTDIIVGQIQIRLFRYSHAGMPQELAQSINVHAVHQTAFFLIIPQTMGRIGFAQAAAGQILLEICLKVAHLDMSTAFPDRE